MTCFWNWHDGEIPQDYHSFLSQAGANFWNKANVNKQSRSFNGKLSIFSILDLNYWFLQKYSLNGACVSSPEGLLGSSQASLIKGTSRDI